MISVRHEVLFAGLALLGLAATAPARADTIVTQVDCKPSSEAARPCALITSETFTSRLRDLRFYLSAPARVLVNFQGGMYCHSSDSTGAVVDLISSITTDPDTEPSLDLPGSLRHAHVYTAADGSTFNLNTSVVFDFDSPGRKNVYFRMGKLRMDPGTRCTTQNNIFTITVLE